MFQGICFKLCHSFRELRLFQPEFQVGVNIRVFINGNLDEKNYDCIREHCDWRKELDDKDRAIGLLLDLIETKRKSHSEDNRLFSPLYSELGDLYEKNGQLAEATESYFKVTQKVEGTLFFKIRSF